MSFKLLSKELQALLNELGYKEETEPQRKAIPVILSKKNVLLISPTGTGKTEAALLPVLDMIKNDKSKGIKVLYITPLRSLNRNLLDRIAIWCGKLDLKVGIRHGDTPASERRKQSLMPPDLLITTPETLQILLVSKNIREQLRTLKHVIVDEIHELAESKRGTQLAVALERLRLLTGEFQLIGLSATIGEPEKLAEFLVGKGRNCEIILAYEERLMKFKISYPQPNKLHEELAEKILTYPEVFARLKKIEEVLKSKRSTLIFTNTRSEAEILASRLRLLGLNVFVHHSSLSKEARLDAEASLKAGEINGIVCTSSLELGIDIGSIDYVIQYNSPRQATRLVQRVGRSGHYFKGIAEGLIIATTIDTFLESYAIAEKAIKQEFEKINIPEKPMDVLAHQITGLLLEYGSLKIEDVLELVKRAYPYRNLTREELERLIEFLENLKPRILFRKVDTLQKATGTYLYYFENLSMIPDQVQYGVYNIDNNEFIGVLDEDFIAEYGEEGTKFILKGEAWEIIKIDEEKKRLFCKKAENMIGIVPTWVGEEIPVEKEIANNASYLRKQLYEGKNLLDDTLIDTDEQHRILKILQEDRINNIPIADFNEFLIENSSEAIILNSCYGTKINKALAKILSYLISDKYKKNFRIYNDAYRVFIISNEINVKDIKDILLILPFMDIDNLMNNIFNENDSLFRFRFLHVAKRFGIIRKNASIDKKLLIELARQYKGTPVYDEALKELFDKDLDILGVKEIARKLAKKEIGVRISERLSNVTKEALKYLVHESAIPASKDPSKFVLEAFKTRLYSKMITIFCIDCLEYVDTKIVLNIQELQCPLCGSSKLAISKLPQQKVLRYLRLLVSGSKNRKVLLLKKKWERIANEISKKKLLAILAFASNASFKDILKLLNKYSEESDEFYISLIKAETEKLKKVFEYFSSR
jgi:ATP-dependent Lhr-like helicase